MSPRLSRAEIDAHLPLKPLTFEVLLALADGERHGWALVRERPGAEPASGRIMPGNFYRTLRAMLADGLIGIVKVRPPRTTKKTTSGGATSG